LRRFFAFPALLIDYRPLRACAFLAPWKDEKSEATRAVGYFNRLLGGSGVFSSGSRVGCIISPGVSGAATGTTAEARVFNNLMLQRFTDHRGLP
jgi:hypothetical protein